MIHRMLYIMDGDNVHVKIDIWVNNVILYNMCFLWVGRDLSCTINIAVVANSTGHDSSLFIHKLTYSFHIHKNKNKEPTSRVEVPM